MSERVSAEWVRGLIERNRYIVLATTDGDNPWVAPVEYMTDEDLNFYFFSPSDVRHVQHIERNGSVAAAVFDTEQPDYTADTTANLNGVQMECTARRLEQSEYSEAVLAAIGALDPPMPPYEVFKITPRHFYVPRIEDGVNTRYEVEMS